MEKQPVNLAANSPFDGTVCCPSGGPVVTTRFSQNDTMLSSEENNIGAAFHHCTQLFKIKMNQ